ncbi:MAG: TIR domain-containing protein [Nitrospira sp.]|nr:TIR domain-containing protein [Nitrospira sp.]
MGTSRNYDLFVTHAWRFHEDWTKFTELMDKVPGILWRNFSLPWHDPAISPNTEAGGRFIRSSLESQIIPVHVVVLLAGVYETRSARVWVDMEVEMARKHRKPIIGMPPINKESIPDGLLALCDASSTWEATRLIAVIDEVRSLPTYASKLSDR